MMAIWHAFRNDITCKLLEIFLDHPGIARILIILIIFKPSSNINNILCINEVCISQC